MATINQNIDDDLLKKFNDEARNRFGDKKGCKRQALIEAITDWLKKKKGREPKA